MSFSRRCGVEGLVDVVRHGALDLSRRRRRAALDHVQERHQLRIEMPHALPLAIRGVRGLVHRQRAQLRQRGLGGTLADGDGFLATIELRRGDVAQLGADQHVVGFERGEHALGPVAHQRRDHLVHDDQRVGQLVFLVQRRTHVDHDQPLRAHVAHDVHRHVVDHATVDEQAIVHAHRCERAGHRHARTDRQREISLREHHLVAGDDVGGDGTERNRELVEVVHVPGRDRQPAHQHQQLLALHDADRQHDATVDVADLQVEQVAEVGVLAPHRLAGARRVVDEHVGPVDGTDQVLHFRRRVSGGVETADDRAHARAGHPTDRDALAFEHLEHADVRRAASAASAEDEADAGRFGGWSGRLGGDREAGEAGEGQGHGGHGLPEAAQQRGAGGRVHHRPVILVGDPERRRSRRNPILPSRSRAPNVE